jgi:hypothetical protein
VVKKRNSKISKKRTVGEQYLEVAYKEPESRDPIELQREIQKEYLDNLRQAVYDFRKKFPQDFFVVQLTKREQLMPNMFRNYFLCRFSCPTPDYDQSVYYYNHAHEGIAYLWTVPDRLTCLTLRENALLLPPSEKQLLQFVLHFFDGTLLNISKKFNKEEKGSPLIDTSL